MSVSLSVSVCPLLHIYPLRYGAARSTRCTSLAAVSSLCTSSSLARTWPSISTRITLKAAGSTLRSTAASAPSTSRLSRPAPPCRPAAAMSLESGAHGTAMVAASLACPHVLLKRSDISDACPPVAPPATFMAMWPPSCCAQTAECRFVAVACVG
eukprot:scaffold70233_cov63-Phaeocystis_antarctica.AAC.2